MELKYLEPLVLLKIIGRYGPIKGIATLHKLVHST